MTDPVQSALAEMERAQAATSDSVRDFMLCAQRHAFKDAEFHRVAAMSWTEAWMDAFVRACRAGMG